MRLSKLFPGLAPSLFLAILHAGPWQSAAAQGTDPALDEAQRLLRQGQHAQALGRIDAYLGNKPKEAQGRFVKGLILTEMKRGAEAIAVFKKLTEDYPELPEPYNNLAVLYAQEKQYDKAKLALEAAIRTHPTYAVAHENLGDIYAKLASQAYGKALQIDATNTTAQSKLAMIRDLVPPTPGKAGGKTPAEPVRLAAAVPAFPAAPPTPARAAAPAPAAAVTSAAATPAAPTTRPAATLPPATAAAPNAPVASTPASPTAAAPAAPTAAVKSAAPGNDPAAAVQAWVGAWSAKDVRGYLASYAPGFQTPDGKDRASWERDREIRINKPGAIEVNLEKMVVQLDGADRATVRFRQHYRSANLKTSANKTLVLVRQNERWLIQEERVN